jgi:NAD(P)-dependent dehydrogenase (short-subunit alcohol dehydrogenase family)
MSDDRNVALVTGGAHGIGRGTVADEGDVELALRQVISWGGRLDALVNNAGRADPLTGAVGELTLAAWCARWSTKIRSVGVRGC